jgi:hypothetical protein
MKRHTIITATLLLAIQFALQPAIQGAAQLPIRLPANFQAAEAASSSLETFAADDGSRAQPVWRLKGLGKLSAGMQFTPNGDILLPLSGKLISVDTGGEALWTFKTAGGSIGFPAVAGDGSIFVPGPSSIQEIKPGGSGGWAFTVYPASGGAKDLWLSYGQGRLYLPLASGLYTLDSAGRLVSLTHWDAGELRATKLLTKFECKTSAATGYAYYAIESTDSAQYRLSAFDTGGTRLWNYSLGELKQAFMAAGSDGTLWVAVEPKKMDRLNRGRVFSFPRGSSQPQWQTIIVDEKLAGLTASATGRLYLTVNGKIVAIDAGSGDIQWSVPFARLASPPAVDDRTGYIYAGCSDKRLIAVAPTGKLAWELGIDGSISQKPLIGPDGFLYAATDNGILYKIRVPEM